MKNKRIGLFIDYDESFYSQRLIEGASQFLQKKSDAELLVFLCGSINSQSKNFGYQRLAVASLINKNNLDGLIFVCGPQESDSTADQIHSYIKSFSDIPVVCIGHEFEEYPCILSSCKESMVQMAEHVITTHKRKKPAIFIPQSPSLEILQRINSFSDVLQKHNLNLSQEQIIISETLTYDGAIEGLENYRKKYNGKLKFDALVCVNDSLAFASMDYLSSCGIKVPDKVIVTGFDDEDSAITFTPSLTTINQNIEKQAYYAAKLLYSMASKGKQRKEKITIHSTAYFRQSCGCMAPGYDKSKYKDFRGKIHTVNYKDQPFFETSKWSNNKNSFIKILQLYLNLDNRRLIDELSKQVETDLTSLKINAAALVLFDIPISTDKFEFLTLPPKAHVLTSFDLENNMHHNLENGLSSFNPQETLLPPGHLSSLDGIHVLSLYNNSILYGYALYKPGHLDPSLYGIIFKMLSSAIDIASNSNKAKKEIQELEQEYDNIKQISMTDEMTGLLNRRGFLSLGQNVIDKALQNGKNGLVLFGDMDGLKTINDTYGHASGDTAIKAEANILRSLFRSSDVCGRLGGDEFAIVAQELTTEKFKELRQSLEAKCQEYNEKSCEKFTLSISIGCVEFTRLANGNLEGLLEIADTELYKEKQKKHNSIQGL